MISFPEHDPQMGVEGSEIRGCERMVGKPEVMTAPMLSSELPVTRQESRVLGIS